MIILAVDPGPEQSAWIAYDTVRNRPMRCFGIIDNDEFRTAIGDEEFAGAELLVMETMEAHGMPVGESVFKTAIWIGRLIEVWGGPYELIGNTKIRLHICHTARAKDPNIRAALIDRFGGSREAAIGTKKKPGPLHGIKTHLWSALALAVTYADSIAENSDADQ